VTFAGTRALHVGRGSFKSLYSSEQASITGRFSNGTCGIQTVGNLGEAGSSMKSIGVPAPKHRNFIGGLQLRQVSAFQLKE
jgi:hypothetical protein